MKRLLRWTVKAFEVLVVPGALLAGIYIGTQLGYGRGVRDMANLILFLRSVEEPPLPTNEGAI